eukprot:TRINITY_DN16892_c0_g1_i4.p1 TRINITY_DN16892_c0_g1~~TRINITY_DN16892_c0_g1_i4.p1  ORF type:complete len:493 (-),score=75.69 TRINITY_DN16892_c0_g1_i4:327-1805(-)
MSGMSIDFGDTAFMFGCMTLVQFMTPGLAFFYGGLVRSTNVLTIMLQSFLSLGLVFVLWYIFVFSLAFGKSWNGLIGDPSTFAFFRHVSIQAPLTGNTYGEVVSVPNIPGLLFAGYQGMFAVITPALMTGAFADRFRVGPYLVFKTVWMIVVYGPVAHWVWGGGWMQQWGVWDFAGGIVVHITSGFSALASLVILGSRHVPEEGPESLNQPHSVPLVALGTAMLWFGWFGFNGGSALASNGVAIVASINSQIAGSTGMIGWVVVEALMGKKPGMVGACVGAVAGLATVTPAAGYIQTWAALVIGAVASVVCNACVILLNKYDIDDALDVWGVHGMGGFTGTVLVGLLADDASCGALPTADAARADCANPGTVTRSGNQVFIQLSCAVIVALYSFLVSYALLWMLENSIGIRPRKHEEGNLDMEHHGEEAYVTTPKSKLLQHGFQDSDDESEASTYDPMPLREQADTLNWTMSAPASVPSPRALQKIVFSACS